MNMEDIKKEVEELKNIEPTKENLEKINEIIKKLENRKYEIINKIKEI